MEILDGLFLSPANQNSLVSDGLVLLLLEIAVNILGQGYEGKELYTCVLFLFAWSLCKKTMVTRQKFMVSKVLGKTLRVVICFILGRFVFAVQVLYFVICWAGIRECIVCGALAKFECKDCYLQHGQGLNTTAFCEQCIQMVSSFLISALHVCAVCVCACVCVCV